MMRLPWTSFASTSSTELFSEVAPLLGILLGVVIVGTIIIFILRRSLSGASDMLDQGFLLDDLRRLHREGELSDEEFDKAKAALVSRLTSATPDIPADSGVTPRRTPDHSSEPPDNAENPPIPPG